MRSSGNPSSSGVTAHQHNNVPAHQHAGVEGGRGPPSGANSPTSVIVCQRSSVLTYPRDSTHSRQHDSVPASQRAATSTQAHSRPARSTCRRFTRAEVQGVSVLVVRACSCGSPPRTLLRRYAEQPSPESSPLAVSGGRAEAQRSRPSGPRCPRAPEGRRGTVDPRGRARRLNPDSLPGCSAGVRSTAGEGARARSQPRARVRPDRQPRPGDAAPYPPLNQAVAAHAKLWKSKLKVGYSAPA